MSTKTLRKRIALVAVSALGFGLVSTVPAFAANTVRYATVSSTAATTITTSVGAATTVTSLTATTLAAATGGNTESLQVVLTGPASGTLTVASVGAAVGLADAITTAGTAQQIENADAVNASGTTAAVVGAFNYPGTYTFKVASAGTPTYLGVTTIIVVPSTSGAATLTASNAERSIIAAATTTTIVLSRNTGGNATDGQILGRVDTTTNTTTVTAGTIFGKTAAAESGITATTAAGNTSFSVQLGTTGAANVYGTGSYAFTFWVDANANQILDSGEITTTYSLVVGAVAAATDVISVSIDKSTLSSTANWNTFVVTASIADVSGRAKTDTLMISETTSLGSVTAALSLTNIAAATVLTRVGTTNTYTGTFSIDTAVTATDYTDTYVTVYTGTVVIGLGSINAIRVVNETANLTGTAGADAFQILQSTTDSKVGSVTAGVRQSLSSSVAATVATVGVSVDKTYLTHSWKIQGAAGTEGEYVRVAVAPSGVTPTSVVPIQYYHVMMGADLTAKITVTAVAPTVSAAAGRADGYTVTVYDGTNTATGTVLFKTVTPEFVLAPSLDYKGKFADKGSVTATLQDQFGNKLGSKAIAVVVTGRNAGTTAATTSATGEYTFAWTDASASTTVLSDTVTFQYQYLPTATSTGYSTATAARKVTYTAAGLDISTVTVSAPSATTTRAIDQAAVSTVAANSLVAFTAEVKDSTGAAVVGALVSFAGGAADLFYGGSTGVTDEFGQATVYVYRLTVGTTSITATSGAKTSVAASPVTWTNRLADTTPALAAVASTSVYNARFVALSADNATAVSEGIIRFTAKVTDRWGNAVSGVVVTFAETGAGRFYNPPASNQVTTNTAGEASIDLNSQAGETGAASVTVTITDALALQKDDTTPGFMTYTATSATNGTPVAAAVIAIADLKAAVKSATSTATINKSTATSTADALLALATALGTRDQASAAVDAAAEATDAANAATDAANAAAEAADAATAAAQDAADAVAALSTQVSEMVAALKKQITSLTNLVIKIQKKVKA
jgi:trimeric autotransporter adhesin